MYKKAQLVMMDLMVSVFIFIIIFSFVILTFSKYQGRLNDSLNEQDINLKALQISDLMIKNKGDPVNWEEDVSKLNNIGLVNSDRKLADNKMIEFIELDYDIIKEKFNIEGFEFYFAIKDPNGRILKISEKDAEKGIKPKLDAKDIVTIKRIGVYGKGEKILEFTLWK